MPDAIGNRPFCRKPHIVKNTKTYIGSSYFLHLMSQCRMNKSKLFILRLPYFFKYVKVLIELNVLRKPKNKYVEKEYKFSTILTHYFYIF